MKNKKYKSQNGISLLEVMVAIVITALGILGIIGLQVRTLIDNTSGNHRAVSIRLIEELSERIYLNPYSIASSTYQAYLVDWIQGDETPSEKILLQCAATSDGCTPDQLAAGDIQRWKALVAHSLPGGDASIFQPVSSNPEDHRLLGVMISWDASQKAQDISNIFSTQISDSETITCPDGKICHLQYIPVARRCLAHNISGSEKIFCPNES